MEIWSPSLEGVLKFNVDSAKRGKPEPTGIGVLRNSKGEVVLFLFPKNVGIKGSNETEVVAILEALHRFATSFQDKLIVESDSSNDSWVFSTQMCLWELHFILSDIEVLSSSIRWNLSMWGERVMGCQIVWQSNGLIGEFFWR